MGALGRLQRKLRKESLDRFMTDLLREDAVILDHLREQERREMRSFYAGLTPEQQEKALGLKEDSSLGLPIDKHPMRYPKHEGDKGQVFGGECNRTACSNLGADYYNKGTYGYYCRPCGWAINGRDRNPLCVEVDRQLTRAEQDDLYSANLERYRGSGL